MFGLIANAYAQAATQGPAVVSDPWRALAIAGAVIFVAGAAVYYFWNRDNNDYE